MPLTELEFRVVENGFGHGAPVVVLLHGYAGDADNLAPFARSLGTPARFVFPIGPLELGPKSSGRAWWPKKGDGARSTGEARDACGACEPSDAPRPRDLSDFTPPELPRARAQMSALLDRLVREMSPSKLYLGGFSQGAMLACDVAISDNRPIAGLVLLSGARIAADEWGPRLATRRGLPVFMSHGRRDADLSFAAAEAFARDLALAGWDVRFCPFDGGHEIPLVVLRGLKRFMNEAPPPASPL